jgi:hypothetical protein
VGVLVVLVVDVGVRVLERLVLMLVLVPLGEMEPHPTSHEHRGEEGARGQRFVEGDGGDDRPRERGGREVRSGPGAAQTTKGEDEQDEARAVSEEADETRGADGRQGRPGSVLDRGQSEVDGPGGDDLVGGDLQGDRRRTPCGSGCCRSPTPGPPR